MHTPLPCFASLLCLTALVAAEGYNPLALPEGTQPDVLDHVLYDGRRDREVPIRIYLPPQPEGKPAAPAPVVLFSHGLGGSRAGSAFLGTHWSARGYVTVFLQHPGSDEAIWRDVPLRQRRAALTQAASAKNYLLRAQDVSFVLDEFGEWNKQAEHRLFQRLDLDHVGMSGHSFGGQTTQAVSGQALPTGGAVLTDPRIKAAIVMSPSKPERDTPAAAFGKVNLPWLLMTGTHDGGPIGNQTPATRREVYPALPPGSKYELVLDGAEHSVFTDRALPDEQKPRNPKHHPAILALSTAFWDAYLQQDPAAQAWLDGESPRSVLEPADEWQRK